MKKWKNCQNVLFVYFYMKKCQELPADHQADGSGLWTTCWEPLVYKITNINNKIKSNKKTIKSQLPITPMAVMDLINDPEQWRSFICTHICQMTGISIPKLMMMKLIMNWCPWWSMQWGNREEQRSPASRILWVKNAHWLDVARHDRRCCVKAVTVVSRPLVTRVTAHWHTKRIITIIIIIHYNYNYYRLLYYYT